MKYGRGAQEPRGKHSAECFFCTCFSGDGLYFSVKSLLYRVKNSNPPARARRTRGRADAGREGVSDMARRLYKFIRAKEKNKFLNWIVELGSISAAARKMGLSRQAHYFWMHEDSDYRRAFAQAREMANDLIEEEAYRRAVEGQDVEIYYKGAKVGSKKVYSDTLLAILLKGAFPEKYKERVQEEHVGDGSSDISWEGDEEDGYERDGEDGEGGQGGTQERAGAGGTDAGEDAAENRAPVPSDESMAQGDSSEPGDASLLGGGRASSFWEDGWDD